jgi:hypothetical protein
VTRYIIRRWEEHVATEAAPPRAPELQNTDGDALLFTVDHYDVKTGKEQEVTRMLAGIPGAVAPERESGEHATTFFDADGQTIIGVARPGVAGLRLETNSIPRADALRDKVEAACGDRLRHRLREHTDPLSQLQDPSDELASTAPSPPEADADLDPETSAKFIQAFKDEHYADWTDQPLPALSDQTPREAVANSRGREQVNLLIKEMEYFESRLPPEERYDFSRIRRELGLEDD